MADCGENRQSIGERLLALRNKNNLTQEELAERLMVSRQSVSKWELSKTLPDVDKLIQLAEMYKVSMDYLIIGKQSGRDAGDQETAESSAKLSGKETEGQLPLEESQASDENGEAGQESEKKNSIDRLIRRSSLLVCMLLSGVLCIVMLVFAVRLFSVHTFKMEGKKQDLAHIDRVQEQYTKAEVTFVNDSGLFVNKNVWLDIPGVREDDYIFCFYDEKDPDAYSFDYYIQTLLLPMIAGIICLIFFITFCMEWRRIK